MFRASKGEDLAAAIANGIEVTLENSKQTHTAYADDPKPHRDSVPLVEVHRNGEKSSRDSGYQDANEIVSEKLSAPSTLNKTFFVNGNSLNRSFNSLDRRRLNSKQSLHYYSPQIARSQKFNVKPHASSSDLTLPPHLRQERSTPPSSGRNSPASLGNVRSRNGSPSGSGRMSLPVGSFPYAVASSPRWLRRNDFQDIGDSKLHS